MGVLATLYIECFLRLWGFCQCFMQSVFLGCWGFGDTLCRVFYQVMGVLATLQIVFHQVMGFWRCIINSVLLGYWGFGRRFIYSVILGYGGFGNPFNRMFYQVMGVLDTLYIECFIRLFGFWRCFIQCFIRLLGFWQRFI